MFLKIIKRFYIDFYRPLQIATLLCLIVLISCCSANKDQPEWDGKFWAADHKTMSVKRNQDKPPSEIKAEDPKFSEGVWVSYQDLACLYMQLINNCESWKNPKPVCEPLDTGTIKSALKEYEESRPK